MRDYKKDYKVRIVEGIKEVHIDTAKAEYMGHKFKDMGTWGRRKYENFLFLANNTKEPIKFFYKP